MIWTTMIFIVKSSRHGAFAFTVSWLDFARGTRGTFLELEPPLESAKPRGKIPSASPLKRWSVKRRLGSWPGSRCIFFLFFIAKNWPLNGGCSAQQWFVIS